MKNLLVLAILAGCGWFGWQKYQGWKGSPPTMALKEFATAIVKGQVPVMEPLLENSSIKPGAFSDLQFCQQMIEHVFLVYYKVDSESIDENAGTAEVRITQNLRFDPIGVNSGTGAKVMESYFHGWMARGSDGAWKVRGYETNLRVKYSETFSR
jgi:hypothetical protein